MKRAVVQLPALIGIAVGLFLIRYGYVSHTRAVVVRKVVQETLVEAPAQDEAGKADPDAEPAAEPASGEPVQEPGAPEPPEEGLVLIAQFGLVRVRASAILDGELDVGGLLRALEGGDIEGAVWTDGRVLRLEARVVRAE